MSDPAGRTRLTERLKAEARRLGFEAAGAAPLRPSDHAALYRRWIEEGRHGDMDYLAREDAVDARLDPGARWPDLVSAVVVAHHYSGSYSGSCSGSYSGQPVAEENPALDGHGEIARYARGRDYHRVVKKKLLALLGAIEAEIGRELPVARAYVDTGPLLERELARRAGIGWFGRNTMLIDPRRGSYFFLGSLLLPLELDYDEPFEADRCGTCNACVDACPTGALLGRDGSGAPVMDATRCISYLTIENRDEIPRELRPLIGNRIYGCDICQEVCPWNSAKLVRVATDPDYLPRDPSASGAGASAGSAASAAGTGTHPHPHTDSGPATASPSLVALMRLTREEWDWWTRGSAMRRAGYAGFKRNVAVALGNWLAELGEPPEEVVAVLRDALESEEELVREHAAWALGRARSSG